MLPHPYKYEEGDIVYEIVRPRQLMVVIERHGFHYYCRLVDKVKDNPMAFIERDLRRKELTQ